TDVFRRSDGLSGDIVTRLFEDREGNIWIATTEGVDRFRTLAAATTLVTRTAGYVFAVTADRDGGIWVSRGSGLERWYDGHITSYRPSGESTVARPSSRVVPMASGDEIAVKGLPDPSGGGPVFQDSRGRLWLGTRHGLGYLEKDRFVLVAGVPDGFIDSIAEDGEGNLWIAQRNAGLLRWSPDRKIRSIPWSEIGLSSATWAHLAIDPVGTGLWLGFFSGEIIHVVDGRLRESYKAGDGLGKGAV